MTSYHREHIDEIVVQEEATKGIFISLMVQSYSEKVLYIIANKPGFWTKLGSQTQGWGPGGHNEGQSGILG